MTVLLSTGVLGNNSLNAETVPVADVSEGKIHPEVLVAAKEQSHLEVLVYLKNRPNH